MHQSLLKCTLSILTQGLCHIILRYSKKLSIYSAFTAHYKSEVRKIQYRTNTADFNLCWLCLRSSSRTNDNDFFTQKCTCELIQSYFMPSSNSFALKFLFFELSPFLHNRHFPVTNPRWCNLKWMSVFHAWDIHAETKASWGGGKKRLMLDD